MRTHITLFPFDQYWWFYPIFIAFVFVLISIDLGVFRKGGGDAAPTMRQAAMRTTIWVFVALCFNALLYFYVRYGLAHDERLRAFEGFDARAQAFVVALEFLTGYVIEQSLSVDNIFVFVVVFRYFAIPPMYQHRVLFYGIIGALVLRGCFIALGSMLIEYEVVMWLFGGFLIYTGVHMAYSPDKEIHPDKNWVLRQLKRAIPVHTQITDHSFFKRIDGVLYMTPLFVALVFLELTDVVFAVDSVPAIFAITREPLIVFTSNIFAILGLRSLYFLLSGALDRFYLLKYGLSIVLVFVGLKMVWLNEHFGGKFPISWSLSIILCTLLGSVFLSLLFPKMAKEGEV